VIVRDHEGLAGRLFDAVRASSELHHLRHLVRGKDRAGVDPARGAIFGHSRGGGVALLHAAEPGDYRALVTWAALDDFGNFDAATKRGWRARGWIPIRNARTGQVLKLGTDALDEIENDAEGIDPLRAAPRLRTPTLLVHGTQDEAVPHAASERLTQAIPGARLLSIEGAGHTFGARHPLRGIPEALDRALDATVAFLAEKL
jgi:pimeloyl-ACP methyl ester carboxylesterase